MTAQFWSELTTDDLARRDMGRAIAVLPVAATEQHGPHLPLATDTLIAEGYLARVRDGVPADLDVLLLPVQPVGKSDEHDAFPGTLSLETGTAPRRLDGDRRGRPPRRLPQAGDRHEPRRQQRAHRSRGGRAARPVRHGGGHDLLGAARLSRRPVPGGRDRPRHPCRRHRDGADARPAAGSRPDRPGRGFPAPHAVDDPRFHPPARRPPPRPSPGRPATSRLRVRWATRDSAPPRPAGRRSTTAPGPSSPLLRDVDAFELAPPV
jgi:hypothetical protein